MEMSDQELDRILAKQELDRDRREATARIADRYISREVASQLTPSARPKLPVSP